MDSTISNKIGDNLAFLRGQRGVTQDAVAAALGVSNKTISKWETGISSPEAEYIPALADYYEVSTDEIFGRVTSKSSFEDIIAREFADLSHSESALKTFELLYKLIKKSIWKIGCTDNNQRVVPDHIVSPNKDIYRCAVSCNIGYEILINSPYTNMATMLYQNESDFSWMEDKAGELTSLFKLLSEVDGIKMIKLMYTQGFSERFTADYIAGKVGMNVEKASELLEFAVAAKVCCKRQANLRDGFTLLYECNCNGMVLAILNLAFELICGDNSNEHCYGESVKMIRGDQR
jgi:transcriptional regulator with XRE-family HTH domain